MPAIVPKLNLNKTPSIVENNSLIFAKNIRLDVDNTIHEDYGITPLSLVSSYITTNNIHTSGYTKYNDLFRRIIADINYLKTNSTGIECNKEVLSYYYDLFTTIATNLDIENTDTFNEWKKSSVQIVGIIPNSNEFYLFLRTIHITGEGINNKIENINDVIVKYDELINRFLPCDCNWHYNGGTIVGNVINNLAGDVILNIGETNTDILVPFKCINLKVSKHTDDESIYTQTPIIPLINLNLTGKFSYVIPNGVYQFFIRYKKYDNDYTDWFPASKDCFAKNEWTSDTNYGVLKYCNINTDASESFIFNVEVCTENIAKYKSFQIGFILSHDDTIVARAWKHFDIKNDIIKFDYKASDAEEIEVGDLIKPTYQIYNVGNCTSFKNKLYISNYTETDFNPDFSEIASNIRITTNTTSVTNGYNGNNIIEENNYISAIDIESPNTGNYTNITGTNGIIDKLLSDNTINIKNKINTALTDKDAYPIGIVDKYGLRCSCEGDNINTAVSNATYQYQLKDNFYCEELQGINARFCNNKSFDSIDDIFNYIINNIKYIKNDCSFVDETFNIANSYNIQINRNIVVHYTEKEYRTNTATIYSSQSLNTIGSQNTDISGDTVDFPSFDDEIPGVIDPFIPGGGGGNQGGESGSYVDVDKTVIVTTNQKIRIEFIAFADRFGSTIMNNITSYQTLIPYQQYKFYIHFINKNGEITNGYLCDKANNGNNEIIIAPYKEEVNAVIYPVFNNIIIPEGYVACFFSIIHSAIDSATIFDLSQLDTNTIESSCIELNTRLLPINTDVLVKQDNIITKGDYYISSNAEKARYFGCNGVLAIVKNDNIKTNKAAYVISDYSKSNIDIIDLIKCTPYINNTNLKGDSTNRYYDDYTNLNLKGYICDIYYLDREQSINFYNDGSNIYRKDTTEESIAGRYIQLKELNKDNNESAYQPSAMGMANAQHTLIYSNWNLNCITINEEPVTQIKDQKLLNSNDIYQIWFHLIPSLTMNDIYTLPSMYYSYTSKTYSVYNKNDKTIFNNTIRCSELVGDENSVNVFKFDTEDYYNTPTNRGTITNLCSIGDSILVHTKDSLFRFNGGTTIQSSSGEIVTTESQPFDTGISEIFGSEFGFAGLRYKDDQIVTENGYIFVDRDAGVIYMYGGNNQLMKLSNNIEKLIRRNVLSSVAFANDFYNNRFFISILYKDGNSVTLSFNFNEQIKDFISLHDFYFNKSFSTKTKCYFVNSKRNDILTINKVHNCIYGDLKCQYDNIYVNNSTDYNIYNTSIHQVGGGSNVVVYSDKKFSSIFDVINNYAYEVIKTLNSMRWNSCYVANEWTNNTSKSLTKTFADVIEASVPCGKLMIYTDTCRTDIIEFNPDGETTDIKTPNSNTLTFINPYSISNPNSYKYPRYNQGYWSLNYFRNVLNGTNKGIDIDGVIKRRDYTSDEHSLIEGKYFVIRFIFDSKFKFETLSLNTNNKI